MATRHWLRLAMTTGLGPILVRRLVDAAGGAAAASDAPVSLLREIDGIGASKARSIHDSMRATHVDEELEKTSRLGARIICPDDAEYPVLLRSIPDPPAVLYVKGAFEPRDLHGIAIVGSRKCSHYGREQSERFAALLAGIGITVISGGARGIDSAAHRGALSHPRGRTIAVLGCGIDVVYPPENDSLFEQIAGRANCPAGEARGAVVSEYPLGTGPLKENFPRRNRIISGLSRGVLVIEADTRSGALITARQACDDHGRTVFALPGRVDNPLSAGPHRLIRDGAVLTENVQDILENLAPLPADALDAAIPDVALEAGSDAMAEPEPRLSNHEPIFAALSDRQRLIISHLGIDPTHVDGIVERTALAAHEVLQELTLLSLKGLVRRVEGQSYARARAKVV
jgi:DNA processing protein